MKVIKKQANSKMCIICGMDNGSSLKAQFYEMQDGSLASLFKFQDIHQSYPERVHGGLITSILDELMGRVIWCKEPTQYAVTATLSIKFKKPVPYNTELKARASIINNTSRVYTAEGKIYDMNNNLLAEATSIFVKLEKNKIMSQKSAEENEMCYMIEDKIKDIDFPQ